jgi:hypothetical protein
MRRIRWSSIRRIHAIFWSKGTTGGAGGGAVAHPATIEIHAATRTTRVFLPIEPADLIV